MFWGYLIDTLYKYIIPIQKIIIKIILLKDNVFILFNLVIFPNKILSKHFLFVLFSKMSMLCFFPFVCIPILFHFILFSK